MTIQGGRKKVAIPSDRVKDSYGVQLVLTKNEVILSQSPLIGSRIPTKWIKTTTELGQLSQSPLIGSRIPTQNIVLMDSGEYHLSRNPL